MKHENYTILIVEDSKTQAAYLQSILEMENYKTRIASNGEEAIKMIEQEQPAMVLTDVIMPLMDGFTLCREIRKEERFANIPVILLTALADPRDIIKGLESGADNFIPKPFTEEYLLTQIESILINWGMREKAKLSFGMDIFFNGEKHFITSERRQIIDLLLSTYENAVNKSNDLVKAHLELSRLNDDLERKKKELEKLNEEKNYFLGMAAHDLKNPLSNILSFVMLMKESMDQQPDNDNLKFMNIIENSGKKMLKLITDLLDVTQLETGKLIAKKERVDLSELIAGNIETNQYLADKKKIGIHFHYPDEAVFFQADPNKLDQVMNNLLTNAIKFSHPQTNIEVTLSEKKSEVIICVEDQGQGIPPEEQKELFKPFAKITVKATQGEPSTGLGLFSVKRIVDAHQGEITVNSVVNKGTKICIALPWLMDEPAGANGKSVKTEKTYNWENHVILVVDDTYSNYLFLEGALARTKVQLLRATDGLDAIQFCKQNPDIDLVLMDIQMPFLNGYEATREIKKMRKDLPVIAQTAYAMDGEDEKCFAAGCDAYISNPVQPKDLLKEIDRFFSPAS
ncbi:MAG: response regulator [Bacteroidales bacterium]|nr:response regulator [Bacteroidales bacterium]